MYSPEVIILYSFPSYFRNDVKMHVFAGMLIPIANVSVANRIFSNPSWNRISIVSLMIGSNPPKSKSPAKMQTVVDSHAAHQQRQHALHLRQVAVVGAQ